MRLRSTTRNINGKLHSRPQSLRSFWPAAGIESSGSNHFERTKEITEFWLSGSLRICIYGACLKWLLPELSFSDRWSKGTRLWERECGKLMKNEFIEVQVNKNHRTENSLRVKRSSSHDSAKRPPIFFLPILFIKENK